MNLIDERELAARRAIANLAEYIRNLQDSCEKPDAATLIRIKIYANQAQRLISDMLSDALVEL